MCFSPRVNPTKIKTVFELMIVPTPCSLPHIYLYLFLSLSLFLSSPFQFPFSSTLPIIIIIQFPLNISPPNLQMGMEILDEFSPLTPLSSLQFIIPKHKTEQQQQQQQDDQEEECLTPTAVAARLKPAIICPPAPKKPRPPRRKLNFLPPPFFEAPQDLNSVYFQLHIPSKKIKPIH